MDSSNLALASAEPEFAGPAALLRGTAKGLQMTVNARAGTEAVLAALEARLAEAPGFFRDNDVRIAIEDGPLPAGCLARLVELADRFALRILEVAPAKPAPAPTPVPEPMPSAPNLAAGSAPMPVEEPVADLSALIESLAEPEPSIASGEPAAEPAPSGPSTRLFIGPVRSGVILDHVGHLIVFGDVNPGAEVRATGNIIVLGRLRGTAHAGIGQDVGFVLALRLEAQQLRIGRKVARSDSNVPSSEAEVAFATGEQIVVETYTGRLPRHIAASI